MRQRVIPILAPAGRTNNKAAMRLVVTRKPLKQAFRWTQRVLFAGGLSLLFYCGFVLADTSSFQKAERLRLARLIEDQNTFSAAPSTAPSTAASTALNGDLFGRLDIPRLGLRAIIMEGADAVTLRRAVGHIEGTGVPGKVGNIGLAGHRDTFFLPLRNIKQKDIITLTTSAAEYRYRVVSTRIVSPYDVAVLDPDGTEILTLVTCYPFDFIGSAPNRFIVRAERVS